MGRTFNCRGASIRNVELIDLSEERLKRLQVIYAIVIEREPQSLICTVSGVTEDRRSMLEVATDLEECARRIRLEWGSQ
jgi:hypothetical protein